MLELGPIKALRQVAVDVVNYFSVPPRWIVLTILLIILALVLAGVINLFEGGPDADYIPPRWG